MKPLATAQASDLPPKAQWLARATQAGLRVPDGFAILRSARPKLAQLAAELTPLLAQGTVIVRSAAQTEDAAHSSAAGLGESIAGLRCPQQTYEAIERVFASGDEHWSQVYRDHAARNDRTAALPAAQDAVIVQCQVQRRWLIVGALLAPHTTYIEVHETQGDVLASGATPSFSGLQKRWQDPCAANVAQLLEGVRQQFDLPEHGFDFELIVDPQGSAYLVQLRALAAPLHSGATAFFAAVEAAGHSERMQGADLVLDAEHNPAPLSPAHAWLMHWLGEQRPKAGRPTTLAGWLYVRTLVRNLAKKASPASEGARATQSSEPPGKRHARPPLTAPEALRVLQSRLLPEARARLTQVRDSLSAATTDAQVAAGFAPALDGFLAMIDEYLGTLVPARAAAGAQVATSTKAPLSMRGRQSFFDVLPATWDVASPPLAEVQGFQSDAQVTTDPPPPLPEDPAEAAVLLTEWDDHLFALGLAPLRAAYLRAARQLHLDAAEVFLLTADEVLARLRNNKRDDVRPLLQQRAQQQRAWTALRPPLRIDHGVALVSLPRHALRGIPIGDSHIGPVCQRRDLADLLERPPSANAIVILPALTAQSAVALHQLKVRAVCCEFGGAMSHAALMARELQLSALIGCRECTMLPDGALAQLDATSGQLRLLPKTTAPAKSRLR